MTNIVPVTKNQRIALKEAPLEEVAEALLGYMPVSATPNTFPAVPTPLKADRATRTSFTNLGKIFNRVVPETRRSLFSQELADIGQEYTDLQNVKNLLETRLEQIKEIVRTHQDVEAEQSGIAFPERIVRNGNVIVEATPRDQHGHYLLSAPQKPVVTEIPESDKQFSNEFRSGRSKTDLTILTADHENGVLDDETYRQITKTVRVVDPEKLRKHVLKTGDVSLLTRVVVKGHDLSAFCFRNRKK